MTERHPGLADEVRTQTFSLTVLNTRPDIVPETIFANEGTTTVYDTQLTDPEPTDPDAPDGAVQWSILDTAALPAGVASIDSSTGQVTITDPSDADVGTYAFRIKIVDGNGGEDTALFWLTIENTAPGWDTVPTVPTVQEDNPVTVTVHASDHGYGTYSIVSGPSWATIDPDTGRDHLESGRFLVGDSGGQQHHGSVYRHTR